MRCVLSVGRNQDLYYQTFSFFLRFLSLSLSSFFFFSFSFFRYSFLFFFFPYCLSFSLISLVLSFLDLMKYNLISRAALRLDRYYVIHFATSPDLYLGFRRTVCLSFTNAVYGPNTVSIHTGIVRSLQFFPLGFNIHLKQYCLLAYGYRSNLIILFAHGYRSISRHRTSVTHG